MNNQDVFMLYHVHLKGPNKVNTNKSTFSSLSDTIQLNGCRISLWNSEIRTRLRFEMHRIQCLLVSIVRILEKRDELEETILTTDAVKLGFNHATPATYLRKISNVCRYIHNIVSIPNPKQWLMIDISDVTTISRFIFLPLPRCLNYPIHWHLGSIERQMIPYMIIDLYIIDDYI